ncbi:MAG: B12-binding domain-containing radical SAM protein [Acidobacteriota bacterium]|nr:B12-binding domain-containing radical SAM protein [Acidobacteriota bacterium]
MAHLNILGDCSTQAGPALGPPAEVQPLRICLLRPPSPELINDRIDPPIGLLQIGTVLRQEGHEVTILDFAGGSQPRIPDADLYGITLFTISYVESLELRDQIREISSAPIMVGGPHAQALPKETAEDFDYVVVGEAEAEIAYLVGPMASRELETAVVHTQAPLDLGALPLNDYSLVDTDSYSRVVDGRLAFSILSGRGCPFRCTYCFTAALAEKVRLRPVDHVMAELHQLDADYSVDALRFIDDNFLMNLRFFRQLAPRLKEFGRPYRVYCRAVDLTEERCRLLAESGCRMVACGVESGSQTMQDLMNTRKDVQKMAEGIRIARRYGIEVRVGLIVGYPGETWETVRESVRELIKMPFSSYNLFNFVPLPGTDPYHNPERYGITWLSDDWKDYYILYGENQASYAFEHETLDRRTLAQMRAYMIESLNGRFMPALNDVDFK